MSLYSQFKMDQRKEVEGVEIKYGPNVDGSLPTFVVARKGGGNSIRFSKAMQRETQQYRRQIELNTLESATVVEIRQKVFVDACLLGWQNIQKPDGSSLSFNTENALALFKELPDLFEDLEQQAGLASLFRDETLESDAKN